MRQDFTEVVDAVRQLFNALLREAIEEIVTNPSYVNPQMKQALMNQKTAANYLGMSADSAHKLRLAGVITPVDVGGPGGWWERRARVAND